MDQLVGIMSTVFDAHSAVLFLRNGDSDHYALRSCFSLGDSIDRGAIISPGGGLAGWILRNNEPLLINNFDRKKGVLGYYRDGAESEIRAFMGCPLGKGLGVVCLDSKRTYTFSDRDQKLLHLFAGYLTSWYTNASRLGVDGQRQKYYHALRLLSGLRLQFSDWSAYIRNYLVILARFTGFEYAFLTATDDWGESYYLEESNKEIIPERSLRFAAGSGMIGWVFKNHRRIAVEDREAAKPAAALFGKQLAFPAQRSVICLPLPVCRRTRCVLVLADEEDVPLTEELEEFLEVACENLVLFLENLYYRNLLTMERKRQHQA